ncbi:MAG: bifunctional methylenetetrahydrofolate dehydrogenase/methenyltetrahydrofolate cyclohydrolase FolD [Nitrososphaerota archaeon]|nr:bifunctional methylenetetrahydrofolate dehydrogenase/methenyltetrahydrofolate cyclohydrolase FolD [Nitrososphaerales archaeon]MDW8044672.1 bifunctional methylenetetrahydrofolate dehydrogenase/methenyltetrahydrofolate cyclohydrolase FolD [Nitrososphaerota archaeon]
MTGIIMDGKALAEEVKARVRIEVNRSIKDGIRPTLATILVGDDPASISYVKAKHKSCEDVGIRSQNYHLPKESSEDDILRLIESLNKAKDIHGILVQLPLPSHIDPYKVIEKIDPVKDVDGLHPENLGKLFHKKGDLIPCTPKGIMALLKKYNIEVRGKNAVIVNRSNLVGKPLYHLLVNDDATVTICHTKTRNIVEHMRNADILVTAVGRRPEFVVTSDMVKEGAIVIDVGMNRIEGKLCGDVDFNSVIEKVSYITPVPGGVGPMTVAMLLENTLIAMNLQTRKGF